MARAKSGWGFGLFLLFVFIIICWALGSTLVPLISAFFLAYLLFPLVKKLEEKGIRREFATLGTFGLVFAILMSLFVLVFPPLIRDLMSFVRGLPESIAVSIELIERTASRWDIAIPVDKESVLALLKKHAASIPLDFVRTVTTFIASSLSNLANFLLSALNLFLFPVFFYYLIVDFERMESLLQSLIPKRFRRGIVRFFENSDAILSGYLRGQMLVILILSLLYGTGLSLVGLKFGFVIGLMTGLLSLIPYVGFTTGLLSALFVAASEFQGFDSVAGVLLVFGLVQTLESFVITPNLVGDRVGLTSLETMIVLIIGGNLAGFVGMLVAIPVGAILKQVLRDTVQAYMQSPFFTTR